MPQRVHKMVERHPSDEVQGEDSWVEIRRPVEDDMRKYRVSATGGKTNEEIGFAALRDFIFDWNWVDDSGAPLPKPADDPDVIGRLTDYELMFLMKFFQEPTAETVKN